MSIETTNLPVVGRKYRNSGGTAGICVCESVCTRFGTVRFVSPDGEQYLIATNVWHTCWTEYDVAETQRTLQKLVDREVCQNVNELIDALSGHQDPCVWSFDPDTLEFWTVTSWFAEKLEEYGETCVYVHGLHVWGRCCSGQAIMLDGVIEDIAAGMEILPGQRYAW